MLLLLPPQGGLSPTPRLAPPELCCQADHLCLVMGGRQEASRAQVQDWKSRPCLLLLQQGRAVSVSQSVKRPLKESHLLPLLLPDSVPLLLPDS